MAHFKNYYFLLCDSFEVGVFTAAYLTRSLKPDVRQNKATLTFKYLIGQGYECKPHSKLTPKPLSDVVAHE